MTRQFASNVRMNLKPFRAAPALAGVAACVWLVAAAMPAHAFTLIQVASVSVSPTSGYPTAAFSVDGTYAPGGCPGSGALFNFFWDDTLHGIGAASLPAGAKPCDTGPIHGITPASGMNGVGSHKIIVQVINPGTGALFTNGQASTSYTIKQAPPPPSPSPKPSPRPSPKPTPKPPPSPVTHQSPSTTSSPSSAATPSSSPGQSACAATGALPPPSTGGLVDTFIAGAMVASVLPIGGIAVFGAGPLLALARRRRLLKLLGLVILVAVTLSCAPTTAPTADASPSPSPSTCTGA